MGCRQILIKISDAFALTISVEIITNTPQNRLFGTYFIFYTYNRL